MTDLIFVYGSLMQAVPSAASKWLRNQATFLAKDSVAGELIDAGRYPGLLINTNAELAVQGEVHRLHDPVQGLKFLDEYEGTDLEVPEYERLVCRTLQGYECWVYQYLTYQQIFPAIPGGDYRTYYPTNSHHLAFINRIDASTSN